MRIGRTIVAVVVALSVATLPAATGFAAGATTAMEISASQAIADCDHLHKAPTGDTQKTAEDTACMAGCALNCFNFVAPSLADIALSSSVSTTLKPVRMTNGAPSSMSAPPFRPPRS